MRKLVGLLAAVTALLIILPASSPAAEMMHPKKYGLELQLGGGFHMMTDINDFVPHQNMLGILPETESNIGAMFGAAMLVRNMDKFGWQIGYNRFVMVQDYRISTFFTAEESWAEQSVTGAEIYFLPTWYSSWGSNELFMGIGPTINFATLDRSVDVVIDAGSHLTSGTFANAKGKALGLMITVGVEKMVGDHTAITLQVGGRNAVVGKLTYEDTQGTEVTVYRGAGNQTLPVDLSGGFVKFTLRTYFKPSSDWRNPRQ